MIGNFPDPDPTDAAILVRLKRWREERGQSVAVLSAHIGLSPRQERLAEAGRCHLNSLKPAATLRVRHLPLWALESDRPVA